MSMIRQPLLAAASLCFGLSGPLCASRETVGVGQGATRSFLDEDSVAVEVLRALDDSTSCAVTTTTIVPIPLRPDLNLEDWLDDPARSSIPRELSGRFVERVQVRRKIPVLDPFRMLEDAEVSEILASSGTYSQLADAWRRFRHRRPDVSRICSVSRVAFSGDRSLALAYAQVIGGITDGEGAFFLLRRVADDWVVEAEFRLWIS